ncbi:unnamed protein product, partial [marine sediment metagenome]
MKMKSKKAITLLVLTTLLMALIPIMPVSAATITVGSDGDDYTTITLAIAGAIAGDTIVVDDGPYTEDLTIDKSLTLEASGAVTIIGNHKILASDVTIDGFTLKETADFRIIWVDSSGSAIDGVTIT